MAAICIYDAGFGRRASQLLWGRGNHRQPCSTAQRELGGPVAQSVKLRGTLDSLGIISVFGIDALYKFLVSGASLGGYIGSGPDAGLAFIGGDNLILGLHATAGLEYFTGELGIYDELQPLIPILGFNSAPVLGKLRAGVNFYF